MKPCANGGACLRNATVFICGCAGNFFGERCQYGNIFNVTYTKIISKLYHLLLIFIENISKYYSLV